MGMKPSINSQEQGQANNSRPKNTRYVGGKIHNAVCGESTQRGNKDEAKDGETGVFVAKPELLRITESLWGYAVRRGRRYGKPLWRLGNLALDQQRFKEGDALIQRACMMETKYFKPIKERYEQDGRLLMLVDTVMPVHEPSRIPEWFGILVADRDLDAAGVLVRRALRKHPEDPQVLLTMAHYHFQAKEFGLAAAGYRKALSMATDATVADCHYGLGLSLHEFGQSQEATESLRAFLHTQPDGYHRKAMYVLASLYKQLGMPAMAKACYRILADRNPTEEIWAKQVRKLSR